jgi:hypothetical protein
VGREPQIQARHHAIERRWDLEGDRLLWIIQPDESGLDPSPKFDAVWGWRADGLPGFPLLVEHNRRLRFDARRVRAAGGPVVCGTITNVLHNLAARSTRPARGDRPTPGRGASARSADVLAAGAAPFGVAGRGQVHSRRQVLPAAAVTGRTSKSTGFRRLPKAERAIERDAEELAQADRGASD